MTIMSSWPDSDTHPSRLGNRGALCERFAVSHALAH